MRIRHRKGTGFGPTPFWLYFPDRLVGDGLAGTLRTPGYRPGCEIRPDNSGTETDGPSVDTHGKHQCVCGPAEGLSIDQSVLLSYADLASISWHSDSPGHLDGTLRYVRGGESTRLIVAFPIVRGVASKSNTTIAANWGLVPSLILRWSRSDRINREHRQHRRYPPNRSRRIHRPRPQSRARRDPQTPVRGGVRHHGATGHLAMFRQRGRMGHVGAGEQRVRRLHPRPPARAHRIADCCRDPQEQRAATRRDPEAEVDAIRR